MGDVPKKLDEYLLKCEKSPIEAFCNGIRKDIASVKNAVSLDVSSEFVEGNNKFKLLKHIVYRRFGLVNLAKKYFLAFRTRDPLLNLFDLI